MVSPQVVFTKLQVLFIYCIFFFFFFFFFFLIFYFKHPTAQAPITGWIEIFNLHIQNK